MYHWSRGLDPEGEPRIGLFRLLSLERGLVLGVLPLLAGLTLNALLCVWWWDVHLGALEIRETMPYAL